MNNLTIGEFKNIFENSCQVEDKVFKLACTVSK